jgi:hypothetical protein
MLHFAGRLLAYEGEVQTDGRALAARAVLGIIGAFDTFYYHEWRARLPARGRRAAAELKLHAARDFFTR